ncbi:MAG: hypothetical protein AB7O98_04295 [Hyphomonadaceae bacterium]
MRRWMHALAAGFALAGFATAAAAQEHERQVRAYLEHGMNVHAERGYARDRAVPDLLQALRLDHPYVWPIQLQAGVNYRVYGACDDDCGDLDMEIYSADGNLADRDTAPDDTPYVQIRPTQSGRHYVRLWLFSCAAEPCFVAARVVSGGEPQERGAAPQTAAPEPGDSAYLEEEHYTSVVIAELEDAERAHIDAGFQRFGDESIAPVMGGETREIFFELTSGFEYIFQGACDQDCSDVDLELLAPDGASAGADDAPDDRPVIRIASLGGGIYTLRASLADCEVEPCYVGVRAYRRPH